MLLAATTCRRQALRLAWAPRRALSYYKLFPKTFPNGGPPNSPFSPPLTALKQEYLRLQASAHPDKLAPSASDADRTRAEANSSTLSVAYRTLIDPLRRAQHVLAERMEPDPLAEDAAAESGPAGVGGDEEFLMDVLMAREGIEDATSVEELEVLVAENKQRVEHTVQELERVFAEDDLAAAKTLTQKLSYWMGIDRQLQDAMEQYE